MLHQDFALFTAISVHSMGIIPSLRQASYLLLANAFSSVNVTNQTFIMKHEPVVPGWRVAITSVALCTCTGVGHKLFLELTWTCAEFYANI